MNSHRRLTASGSFAAKVAIAGASAMGFVAIPTEGTAQTFNAAASNKLNQICTGVLPTNPIGNLSDLCGAAGGGPISTTGPGTISAPTLGQRLEKGRPSSDNPEPGASSDTAQYSLGSGVNAFVIAGDEALNHHNNKFETGYSSRVPTVVVGADYRITQWMTAGLAVNYTYQDGTYDGVGHFHTQSYGPLIFASFVPLPNTFTDIALGYNHQDYFRNRRAEAHAADDAFLTNGHARGNFNGDQYSVGFLAGYDHPLQGFTIGPRAGLNYVYYDREDYSETSSTGLALRYSGLNQSSLQTTVGAVATMPFSTSLGVVQPQIGVSWVHEFLNDARNIQAEYLSVTDPSATQFTFKREQPARDWAVIDLAASMVLPNQLQPFVSFTTIQGNENFVSYGGVLGVRMSLQGAVGSGDGA